MPRPTITPQLAETRLMAILRAPRAADLVSIVDFLVAGGVRCLEVTLTTEGALDLVERLRGRLPASISVGAGSVLTPDDARQAVDSGADFLVAPSTNAEVIRIGCAAGKAVYPGAWTATEIVRGWDLGAAAVKLFPASVGGPDLLRQLRQPLPSIPLLAVGGVHQDNIRDYLDAGACAVGVGSTLTDRELSDDQRLALVQKLVASCARSFP